MLARPETQEFAPRFAQYIERVDDEVMQALRQGGIRTQRLAGEVAEHDATYRYAPGKWSVKEILGHIADTERVMALRLLWAARGDGAPLPGFDQDAWTAAAAYDAVALGTLCAQLAAVRDATLGMAAVLPAAAWTRTALVGGSAMSARALLFVIAGHEMHHQAVLQERYLSALTRG